MNYCGIDVSKGKSEVCILDKDKNILFSDAIKHNLEDFQKLEAHLTKDTIIGMESTGTYSAAIHYYLSQRYTEVYYVDTLQMYTYARLRYLHIKSDRTDSRLIAEYLMTEFKRVIPIPMNELKDVTRLYYKTCKYLCKYKKSFLSQLEIIFPELGQTMFVKKSMGIYQLLLKYPTPKDILETDDEELLQIMNENMIKSHYTMKHINKIKNAAKTSIGVPNYPTTCFRQTIELLMIHQRVKEEIIDNIQILIGQTPYIKLLEKYGYGVISLAQVVGEVGDVRRFRGHKQFVKYCGFDVSQKQSGKMNSVHCFISKKGSKYLRAIFYQLVPSQLRSDKEEFYEFYNRLKGKGKNTRVCMVAVARKIAVRTYYDMLKCH